MSEMLLRGSSSWPSLADNSLYNLLLRTPRKKGKAEYRKINIHYICLAFKTKEKNAFHL